MKRVVVVTAGDRTLDQQNTPQRLVRELGLEMMASPASVRIIGMLRDVAALGFDHTDPQVIRRAIDLCESRYAEQLAAEERRRPEPSTSHDPIVYYMLNGGLVKIGTSTNVIARMEAITPERLAAVEPGDAKVERQRHREFADLRSHREWFRLDDRLAEHVEAARIKFEEITGTTLDAWLGKPSTLRKPPTLSE